MSGDSRQGESIVPCLSKPRQRRVTQRVGRECLDRRLDALLFGSFRYRLQSSRVLILGAAAFEMAAWSIGSEHPPGFWLSLKIIATFEDSVDTRHKRQHPLRSTAGEYIPVIFLRAGGLGVVTTIQSAIGVEEIVASQKAGKAKMENDAPPPPEKRIWGFKWWRFVER
jgi:hypothetical protein